MTKVALVSLVDEHNLPVGNPEKLSKDDLVEAVVNSLDFGGYSEEDTPPESPVLENKTSETPVVIERLYVNLGAGRWGSKAKGNPFYIVVRANVLQTGVLAPNVGIYKWLLTLKTRKGIALFQKDMPIKKAGPASAIGLNSMSSGA